MNKAIKSRSRVYRWKRTLHAIWASLRGYFWLSCPRCGEFFGGHEIPKTRFYAEEMARSVSTGRNGIRAFVCRGCYKERLKEITK